MTILKPAPVSISQFDWDPVARKLSGEVSSTNGFGRVYDDACDVGLTIFNARSGREVVFAVDHTERDGEGDVRYWTLRPAGRAPVQMTVQLFND
jgi:hypothetical protein